jgi:hypothetical protein
MTRLSDYEGKTQEDIELLEFEAELDTSADKVLDFIEEARGKMTDAERERADRRAAAILKHATESVTPSRRRA